MKNILITFIAIPFLLISCASTKKTTIKDQSLEDDKKVVAQDTVNLKESATQKEKISQKKFYDVEEGDTLMWIAFKVYGDYTMWRELVRQNPQLVSTRISVGDTLRYTVIGDPFVWEKIGDPYLIIKGDTLGKVSRKVYGTTGKWKDLWENNLQMIKDPDLIFAGFTLYYIPENNLSRPNNIKDEPLFSRR